MVSGYEEDFKTLQALIRDVKEDNTILNIRVDKVEGRLKKLEEK